MNPKPIRAVAYYRKSNDDKGELGESIEQQRQWATEAASRENVVIVREFSDQSISGADVTRPGLIQMRDFCEEQSRLGNPIEAVVCWKANRFSRADIVETAALVKQFRAAGTSLMFTSDGWIDFHKDTDLIVFTITQQASSHAYLKNCSADTRRGKAKIAREGKFNGGKPPFGYRAVKIEPNNSENKSKRLELHPDEAPHVAALFDAYANTDTSIWGLVNLLRDRGVKSATGKALWVPQTVRNLLRNPLYLGDLVYGRATESQYVGSVSVKSIKTKRRQPQSEWITVAGAHPAIVSRELFDKVQVKLVQNQKRTSPRKVSPFALSGLLVCGKCGARMISHTHKNKYRYYSCSSYHTNGPASGCGRNTVDDGRMIRAIVKKLAQHFTAPETIATLRAEIVSQDSAARPTSQVPELEARFSDLDRRIGKLVERLEDDLPDEVLSDVRNRIRTLSEERNGVRTELASVKAAAVATEPAGERLERLVALVSKLEEAVQKANPAIVSEMMRCLLDRVEVFFTTRPVGTKRTRATFARALLYLNPTGWISTLQTARSRGGW